MNYMDIPHPTPAPNWLTSNALVMALVSLVSATYDVPGYAGLLSELIYDP